ncbi:GDP-D-glucose phosphorylase 1 [Episyrphus balteatus]|uniref:GDP-D-glucose phosphorylase 1 n=1 Tax=Episyrphus balteatus TaxID=286459 RepID=UPI002485EF1C|nr:GDP-D-glucose phosphorylase 1 [Episyrphus balteatus]
MSHKEQLDFIKQKWTELHNEPGVFKYKLNVASRKYLPGKYNIYTELNPDRSKLRRLPLAIPSLFTEFDHNKFNFNKIKPNEKLLDIPFEDTVISFLINQSPLTPYHSLICPDLEKSQPQLITEKALEFSIEFLLSIDEKDYRIGYNSPGALASVNHLHLHLMYMDFDLYIEKADLESIGKTGAYRLHDSMPTEAICFLIDENNKETIVKNIYALIEFMFKHSIPHNIFITPDRQQEGKQLKLFIYARGEHFVIKDVMALNVAFLEFSGYFPLGDSELFNNLTEDRVLEKIKQQTGNVYTSIYKYLNEL